MQLSRSSSKLKESRSFGDNSPVLQVKKTRRQSLIELLGELNKVKCPRKEFPDGYTPPHSMTRTGLARMLQFLP
jgi:hypothetical protein